MEEKLLKELNLELQKMEEYRAKLAAMEKSQVNDVRLTDCDTLINHVKCAIAKTEYADKIVLLKSYIGVMSETQKKGNEAQLDDIAAQLIYQLFKMDAEKAEAKEEEKAE